MASWTRHLVRLGAVTLDQDDGMPVTELRDAEAEATGPVTGDLLLELARDGFAVFVAVPLRATVE